MSDLPPHDPQAEQVVLGAMMLDPAAIAEAAEVLRPADFFSERHAAIFVALMSLFGDGKPTDPVAVADELTCRGEIKQAGGAPYLLELFSLPSSAGSVAYYANLVAEKATLRRLGVAGQQIAQFARGDDPQEAVERSQAVLQQVIDVEAGSESMVLGELLAPAMDELDTYASADTSDAVVPTGHPDLDAVLGGGLRGGQMVIVAARPGIGKTTLGLDFMRSCSIRHGLPSLMFSLEMSRIEITHRLLSAEARVRLSDMRAGCMSDEDWARLARRTAEIEQAPLHVDDSPSLPLPRMQAKARMHKARHGLRLLVVDYLQLASTGGRADSRQAEVSELSRSLKLLAKELDVPVVAVSQLNRGPEQRTDKRPMLSDLRESGSLEQDADIVLLIHRPDCYDRDDPRAGEADLVLAKHRAGPTATVTVAQQLHYSRFASLARGGSEVPERAGWGQ